ncbi:unnamed protein product [Clonostachys rosea]|uniref:Uncharacterized protein n=1 Tax=Bionectria ochroleuca TaxID=29856 RepID=A0ABY6TZI3_BIOOC|nr:unnamed protein product [Clonostachys rosea]
MSAEFYASSEEKLQLIICSPFNAKHGFRRGIKAASYQNSPRYKPPSSCGLNWDRRQHVDNADIDSGSGEWTTFEALEAEL